MFNIYACRLGRQRDDVKGVVWVDDETALEKGGVF